MSNCIFCQIVEKKSPASIFYEDDIVIGLMTIGPITPGHVLIIPKKHATYLNEMDEETGHHLFTIVQRSAKAIRDSGVKCEGINLFLADGEAAFQEVFHVHMHVFPRHRGDSFKLIANRSQPVREELDRVAHQIKVAYDQLWRLE